MLSTAWKKSDGSHGTIYENGDGSRYAETYLRDGSLQKSTDNGDGHTDTKFYTPWGTLVGHSWTNADGSHGNERFDGSKTEGVFVRADKTTQTFSDDGKGNIVIREYGSNKQLSGVQWWQSDGSHGSETIDANKVRVGVTYAADGHYTRYSDDGHGNANSTVYSKDGKFISSNWKTADGSVGGTLTDENGTLVIYANYGVNSKDGRLLELYETNGVFRQEVDYKDHTQRRVIDDGEGLRIETSWGQDGVGITSNKVIQYNPDGSGTITTTDASGHTSESHFGPGGIPRIDKPDNAKDQPSDDDGVPQVDIPFVWDPSVGKGDPRDLVPDVDDLPELLKDDGGDEIVHQDDGQKRDDDTIEDIENDYDTASRIPSPIILDLDGDGVETLGVKAGAHFDHTADGFAEQTGWVGKNDGLLVRDLNGNGSIDNGRELFGSETLLLNGLKAANGFDALRELDDNADGQVDASDAAFATLKIWKDVNGDGQSSAAELFVLGDAGVQAINLVYTNATAVDANGNQHKQIGSYTTTAGLTGVAEDVWFQTGTTFSQATTAMPVPADVAALPNIAGFGKVYDLQQAMVRDTSGKLKDLVVRFSQAQTAVEREALLLPLIYQWAGVSNVAPNSRAATQIYGNVIGDARKLEALEEFMGREWFGVWCWGTLDPNPHGHAAPVLLKAFAELAEMFYCQLTVQAALKPLFQKISYVLDDDGQTVSGDLWRVAADIRSAVSINRSAGKELLSEFMRCLKGLDALGQVDMSGFIAALAPLGADVVSLVHSNWAVVGTAGNDTLAGAAGPDLLQGLGGNDKLTGNAGADILDGSSGNDTLYGNAGADTLYGGSGTDQLYGGAGVDHYYFGRGDGRDSIHEDYLDDTYITIGDLTLDELDFSRSGADLVVGFQTSPNDAIVLTEFFKDGEPQSMLVLKYNDGTTQELDVARLIQATLQATEQADALYGSSLADTIAALGGDDLVLGRGGDDTIDGGSGADNLKGGDGNDELLGAEGSDALYGDAGQDLLVGGDGNDRLYGGSEDDSLSGGDGQDRLDGESGSDTLAGGAGDDTYLIDDPLDVIVELADQGLDAVLSLVSVSLSSYVENATLDGETDINACGNELNNALIGNEGANVLLGLGGDDELHGGGGNDSLDGGDGIDMAYGGAGDDQIAGGAGDDRLYGQLGHDTLVGGGGADLLEGNEDDDMLIADAGADLLDGGAGADTMSGGLGDDTYIVDNVGDLVVEAADQGLDTVNSSVSITLSAQVENLLLVSYDDIDGIGNNQANVIFGNSGANRLVGQDGDDELYAGAGQDTLVGGAGNDRLDGMEGVDEMSGGLGDDVYAVDSTDDLVLENAGEGRDTVYADLSYTLSSEVEDLVLKASSGYASGTGNALDNYLLGNDYGNRLDGAGGVDTLEGGLGDDTYVVDTLSDQIIETPNGGFDRVEASLSYTLGEALEGLKLIGSSNINATGNAADNELIGNSGNNRLDGGAGSDHMAGGAGDDVYIVDQQDGRVSEGDDEGQDTVIRNFNSQRYLDGNVENLILLGTVKDGYGNTLDNVITGNDVANTLLGNEGSDTLIGGVGEDELLGDIGADSMVGGTEDDYFEVDCLEDIAFELPDQGDDYVRATLSWTLGDNLEYLELTGSEAWTATGNALNNGLWGSQGNNLLVGGLGNDYLVGNGGNDVYLFNKGDGQDTIDSWDVLGAVDTVRIMLPDTAVSLMKWGTGLLLRFRNSTDQIYVNDYYAAVSVVDGQTGDKKIDRVEFSNGVVWDQALIQTVIDRAANDKPPVASGAIPALTAKQGSFFSYVIPINTITDPDPWDAVSYSVKLVDNSALPSWLSFDPLTRTLSGTPGAANTAKLQLLIWGTDLYGAATYVYTTLTVGAANKAPVLATALPDQTGAEGTAFSYTVAATAFTDPDVGDTLSYSATLADGSALPSWLNFNAATRAFTGTPLSGTAGKLSLKVTAKDSGNLMASDVFDLTISVPNLKLTGTANADTLSGGGGNDTITGVAGNDVLNGNAGNDSLDGGAGNDNLLGGLGNDTLLGGTENDTLDGGVGNDSLSGGAGNDVYYIDSLQDVIAAEAGTAATEVDAVFSSVTWILGTNIENLTLTGSGVINGTGNAAKNVLTGNDANNTLSGLAGDDSYDGKGGNDALVDNSTTSNDTYIWGRGAGVDTVTDAGGTADLLSIVAGAASNQIWLSRSGSGLQVAVIGTADRLVINNWYAATTGTTLGAGKLETLRTTDGNKSLTSTKVQALVDAMASFSPSVPSTTTLPANTPATLTNLIASSWV